VREGFFSSCQAAFPGEENNANKIFLHCFSECVISVVKTFMDLYVESFQTFCGITIKKAPSPDSASGKGHI